MNENYNLNGQTVGAVRFDGEILRIMFVSGTVLTAVPTPDGLVVSKQVKYVLETREGAIDVAGESETLEPNIVYPQGE